MRYLIITLLVVKEFW